MYKYHMHNDISFILDPHGSLLKSPRHLCLPILRNLSQFNRYLYLHGPKIHMSDASADQDTWTVSGEMLLPTWENTACAVSSVPEIIMNGDPNSFQEGTTTLYTKGTTLIQHLHISWPTFRQPPPLPCITGFSSQGS